jgi:hypothetical protein
MFAHPDPDADRLDPSLVKDRPGLPVYNAMNVTPI